MYYRPNPLLYGVSKDFLSSFRLVVTMRSAVNHDALSRAVAGAMVRYPYFSMCPRREGNRLLLQANEHPVPVFADDRCALLGSEESNGHLLTFGCKGRRIVLDASHFIADGMGIVPLLNTVLYLYVSECYGPDGLDANGIQMPDAPVMPEEYAYPFPETPFDTDARWPARKAPETAYALDPEAFDGDGLYAYHLHIPQKRMMAIAAPSDGSPVSFLSVMLYQALCTLDAELDEPVVVHVQHQYRQTLKAPLSRHSLVSYLPVSLPPKVKGWNTEWQNTAIRGQVIVRSSAAENLRAVNRLVTVFPEDDRLSFAQKTQAMRQYVENSIGPKTCGISYVGKFNWCGLDRYVEDIHAYIGEKHTPNMLLMEVMTVGEDFTINFMQSGRGDRYVKAFVQQLQSYGVPVQIVGEERYALCDTVIPE